MKKVVLFALIAALCAGVLLYFYLGKLEAQKQVKIEYDNVVVATVDIPAYTPITGEMLTIKQIPQGYAHPQSARTLDEVVGLVTERDIVAGEQLLPSKLKQFGETDSGLSYVVPEGMRAVTVAVDEVTGVAGFLQRGDYVDVIAYTTVTVEAKETSTQTEGEAQAEDPQTQSSTLVAAQNVYIAAVGMSLNGATTTIDGEQTTYSSVTLILSPEDAMRVIQGSRSGAIVLILRAAGDHTPNLTTPMINDQLLAQSK